MRRFERLVELLSRLPGVGEKTALRYAMFLCTTGDEGVRELGRSLLELRDHVKPCARCGNLAEADETTREAACCGICADAKRTQGLLCVVARVQDLLAIERSGAMRGRYFVLGRLLSPLDGIRADDLPLEKLKARVADAADPIREVLIATPPSVDGEATALLLARTLASQGVRFSRIASGIPHGGDLEFFDQVTLLRAIEDRRMLSPETP